MFTYKKNSKSMPECTWFQYMFAVEKKKSKIVKTSVLYWLWNDVKKFWVWYACHNYEWNLEIPPQARKLHNKYATQLNSNYSKQVPKKNYRSNEYAAQWSSSFSKWIRVTRVLLFEWNKKLVLFIPHNFHNHVCIFFFLSFHFTC